MKMSECTDSVLFRKMEEAENFRRVAFFGIFISTIAALTSVIVIPMVLIYLQRIQSTLQVCKIFNLLFFK